MAALSVPPFDGQTGTGGMAFADADGTQRVVVTYSDLPGPWTYTIEGSLVKGEPMITKLSIGQRDPATPISINQTRLRRVQVKVLFERIKHALHTDWSDRVSQLLGDARTQLPKSDRSWHAQHYLQVSWAYTEAEKAGRPARKAIADQWKVSLVTASRWLSEARKRGYLPPYVPGRNRDTEDDLWSRQRFATSIVEKSAAEAFFHRVVSDAVSASSETALDTILDTALSMASEAISRCTATEQPEAELRLTAFIRELLAFTRPGQPSDVRSAANVLLDVLAPEEGNGSS
ncbi:hypothetical protein ACFO5K_13460 [Nocardia halotolerans]|uniref:Uncharacterized protein n=1 Tax=Nocardia halotolerans TaxID=1755878 RepID=A0ABV8VGD5_9NOCA